MVTLKEFEQNLREALTHLYDPTYRPPKQLWAVMGGGPQQEVEAIQTVLVQAIKHFEPTPEIPSSARIRRFYEVLSYRFIQGLTQEETAEVLNLSLRHIRREQQRAIGILARRLWEQKQPEMGEAERPQNGLQLPAGGEAEAASTAWRSQVRQELISLQKSAPGIVTEINAAVASTAKLANALLPEHNISLQLEPVPPNLAVMLHPSVLNQILITAIEKLVQVMASGEIVLRARREGDWISITIAGRPVAGEQPPYSDLIHEILNMVGGSTQLHMENERVSFELRLPSAHKILVLVVDDNADLVHFYRRYTSGTRYQIIHAAEGQRVFELIEETPPDLIVLDVMLPDIDGWELLTQLREHPATQATPIIVCSVVRREKLALALGAAMYVPKPVRYEQFIQALDQTLNQVAT